MNITAEYLKKAINGEASAAEMYLHYSKIAKDEGYMNIARLFNALDQAERVHIKNHRQALGNTVHDPVISPHENSSTMENLKTALAGETWEFRKMYPSFIRAIKTEMKEEYAKVGRLSMLWASMVERRHARLLKAALKDIKAGRDFQISDIYVCRVCGNLESGDEPDDACPVCGHDKMFYRPVTGSKEVK